MLTPEDMKAIQEMLEQVLEERGVKKPPSAAALRQQRYRERVKARGVTGHNESVTASPERRNSPSRKRNGSRAFTEGPVVTAIPLVGGAEYEVHQSLVDELEKLYPAVDVPQTLREIRGWNLTRPTQRKTEDGILKHINGWLKKEQNKG